MARRQIADSRVLVTGASGGIGRALAIELARKGADLVVVARREAELRQLADDVVLCGRRCEVVVGDITEDAVRRTAVDRAREALGGLDLLVNNAGVGALGPFAQAAPQRLRQVMELNFFALAELTRLSLPLLEQGRQPMIVNLGSVLAHVAVPGSSEYCASKFAVRGLSQALRAELKPVGIEVLLVSPGSTQSGFWEHLVEQKQAATFRGRATPAEVVARRLVRAIERGERELFPTWSAWLIAWVQRFSPGLVDRYIASRQEL